MPNLELRRRMAEALGWTDLSGVPGGWSGTNPQTLMQEDVPHWEESLDACLRDALPVARAKGYEMHLHTGRGQACVRFVRTVLGDDWSIADTAAEAFCLAFLQLMEGRQP